MNVVYKSGKPPKPVATPEELASGTVRNRFVFLYVYPFHEDVAKGYYAQIREVLFEDCTIAGPAVLAPMHKTLLIECSFSHPNDFDAMWWPRPEERPKPVGIIVLSGCVFKKCSFLNIAFSGPRKQIDEIKQQLRSPD